MEIFCVASDFVMRRCGRNCWRPDGTSFFRCSLRVAIVRTCLTAPCLLAFGASRGRSRYTWSKRWHAATERRVWAAALDDNAPHRKLWLPIGVPVDARIAQRCQLYCNSLAFSGKLQAHAPHKRECIATHWGRGKQICVVCSCSTVALPSN